MADRLGAVGGERLRLASRSLSVGVRVLRRLVERDRAEHGQEPQERERILELGAVRVEELARRRLPVDREGEPEVRAREAGRRHDLLEVSGPDRVGGDDGLQRIREVLHREVGAGALEDRLQRQDLDGLHLGRELRPRVEAPAAVPRRDGPHHRRAKVGGERRLERLARLEDARRDQRRAGRQAARHRLERRLVRGVVHAAGVREPARQRVGGIVALAGDRDAAPEEDAPLAAGLLDRQHPVRNGAPD